VAYGPGQAGPSQPAVPTGTGPVTAGPVPPYPVSPSWLAATADRERAVGVLRAGFAEGRLTQEELADRVAQAYTARTYGELWALTADLPVGPLPWNPYQGPGVVAPPAAAPVSNWRSAAALIITALVIFTLAALVTAIITTHVQPGYPGFGKVRLQPYISKQLPPGAPVMAPLPASGQ
jgi:hypothetical protein